MTEDLRLPCKHSKRYRNPQGYPVRAIGERGGQRKYYEHRLVYAEAYGPIPEDMTIDHLCHGWDETCAGGPTCLHRRCIELTHLEAVPKVVNILRGRGPTAANAAKTHCKHGHEFTPENTYYRQDSKNGIRQCRICIQDRNRQRSA